jgi:hypothetical protein
MAPEEAAIVAAISDTVGRCIEGLRDVSLDQILAWAEGAGWATGDEEEKVDRMGDGSVEGTPSGRGCPFSRFYLLHLLLSITQATFEFFRLPI